MNGFKINAALAGIILLTLTGCSGMTRIEPVAQTQVGGFDVLTRSPERHLVMFQTPDDIERFCMSPTPDAIATRSEGLNFGTSLTSGAGERTGEDNTRGALSLGGRAPSVLITRELMYRACELSMNIKADNELMLQIYRETLETLKVMIANQNGLGAPAVGAQPADPRLEGVDMKQFCEEYPGNAQCKETMQ